MSGFGAEFGKQFLDSALKLGKPIKTSPAMGGRAKEARMLKVMMLRVQLVFADRRVRKLIERLRSCYDEERMIYTAKVQVGVPEAEAAEESVDMSVHIQGLLDDAKRNVWGLQYALQR